MSLRDVMRVARLLRLVAVSLPETGRPEGGRYEDMLTQAARVGLRPCGLETRFVFLNPSDPIRSGKSGRTE